MFTEAPLEIYMEWLRGYLARGGRLHYYRDRPFGGMLLAQADFTTGGECGADSREIIVPPGVRWLGGQLGHNRIHVMDRFALHGYGVEVFTDPEFHSLPGYAELRSTAERERAAWEAKLRHQDADYEARASKSDLSRYIAGERSTRYGYTAHGSEPVSVYVEPGSVVVVPSMLPARLTPAGAVALAERLTAAAQGAVEDIHDATN